MLDTSFFLSFLVEYQVHHSKNLRLCGTSGLLKIIMLTQVCHKHYISLHWRLIEYRCWVFEFLHFVLLFRSCPVCWTKIKYYQQHSAAGTWSISVGRKSINESSQYSVLLYPNNNFIQHLAVLIRQIWKTPLIQNMQFSLAMNLKIRIHMTHRY